MLYGLNKRGLNGMQPRARRRQAGEKQAADRPRQPGGTPAAGRAHPGRIPETGRGNRPAAPRRQATDSPATPH
ncbi:MAG: hypothetical protein CSA76_01990 [Spirochaetales bacterium]|nr:MAG: hypothetical protein CSA76_01990 [Spirochaetales bacterium]